MAFLAKASKVDGSALKIVWIKSGLPVITIGPLSASTKNGSPNSSDHFFSVPRIKFSVGSHFPLGPGGRWMSCFILFRLARWFAGRFGKALGHLLRQRSTQDSNRAAAQGLSFYEIAAVSFRRGKWSKENRFVRRRRSGIGIRSPSLFHRSGRWASASR